jgi:acyl phosphate:glycerol-3-phosphate acyltransferase
MTAFLTIAICSYLLGSIPFGYLLVRVFHGQDIRASGSGNIGATNVARYSPWLGLLTLLLDAAKGLLAVLVTVFLCNHALLLTAGSSPRLLRCVAALCAVIGHVFPVWLKFRGGKGVATGLGSFLLIAPKAVVFAVGVFVVIVAISRYVSLGSVIAVALFPVLAWWMKQRTTTAGMVAIMAAASLLIVAKHHANLRRLWAGTESRFYWGRG